MQDQKAKDQYLFICTGSKCHELAKRDSDGVSVLQKKIKATIKERGWNDTIRISKSGCLGSCETAPNVLFQPENRLCSHVSLDDAEEILKELENTRQ